MASASEGGGLVTDASAGPVFRPLAAYYGDPALLRPPPEVIPRIAWESRSTLLAAAEKSGKSTLVGNAIAARHGGREFLGGHPRPGLTLWIAIDEPVGDLVRRLHELEVPGDAVRISELRPSSDQLTEEIRTSGADLVIVDCLTAFAQGLVTDSKSPTEWQLLLQPFNAILRETKAAAVIIHHTIRAGTRYADSRQIGAAVDMILEMQVSKTDRTARKVEARGRVRSEQFSLRYLEGRYELATGELSVEMRTYRAIHAHPGGIGTSSLRKAVGGKKDHVDAAVADLLRKGAIQDVGTATAHAYVVAPPRSEEGPGLWQNPEMAGQRSSQARAGRSQVVAGQEGPGQGQDKGQGTLARSRAYRAGPGGGLPVSGSPTYCRIHPASELERSPLTEAFACSSCTPGLFPDRVREVEGGLVSVPTPTGVPAR